MNFRCFLRGSLNFNVVKDKYLKYNRKVVWYFLECDICLILVVIGSCFILREFYDFWDIYCKFGYVFLV